MGRPSKILDPEVPRRIVKAMSEGNFFDTSCSLAGLDPKAGRDWLRRGARSKNPDDPYRRFFLEVEAARATSEDGAVLMIRRGQLEDWKAAAWWLERRHPKKWGAKISLIVEGELNAFFDRLERNLVKLAGAEKGKEVIQLVHRAAAFEDVEAPDAEGGTGPTE